MKVTRGMAPKNCWFALATLLALLGAGAPAFSAGTALVVTDGVNLRTKSGQAYNQAPTIGLLSRGDYVRLRRQQGQWALVETPERQTGWVESQYLQEAPNKVKPLPLSEEWKTSLGNFLSRLRQAVKSGQFQNLEAFLSPRGLILGARSFPDAVQKPSDQAKAVIPCWYATDVSLTYGSAWELLMEGTNPPNATAYWDEATDDFRLGKAPSGKESFSLHKEGPLLPDHLRALTLADRVYYLEGLPSVLEGFPEPQSSLKDPYHMPFARVYKVSKDRYMLRTLNGAGLVMVITARPGEGWRVRALYTQAE